MDKTYTKTALSEEAGVPLKTLYLDGTLEELVTVGLLESTKRKVEETLFSVDDGSAALRQRRPSILRKRHPATWTVIEKRLSQKAA